MATSKRNTGSASRKAKAAVVYRDDAPPLGATFFARAQLNKAGKPVRGRPKLVQRKMAVSLRLDPDVVDAYKATGEGWQTTINAHLRKAVGLIEKRAAKTIRKSAKKA